MRSNNLSDVRSRENEHSLVRTTININKEIRDKAKDLKINISKTCESALLKEIMDRGYSL